MVDDLEQYLGKHVLAVYRELVRRPDRDMIEQFVLFGRASAGMM